MSAGTVAVFCWLGAVTLFAQDITTWINGAGGKPALAVIDFRGSGLAAVHGRVQFDAVQRSAELRALRHEAEEHVSAEQSAASGRSSARGQRSGFCAAGLGGRAGERVPSGVRLYGGAERRAGALRECLRYAADRIRNRRSLLAQRYAGSLDEAGAIHVAHEFANDIIQKFGGTGRCWAAGFISFRTRLRQR